MKKVTFLLLLLIFSVQAIAQVLNQSASWPNTNWTITGTYVTGPTIFEADPTLTANFAYDDDDAGTGANNDISAESPVIDLTAAFNAGETWLFLNATYVYNNIGADNITIQYWNADASTWNNWGAPLTTDTPTAPTDNFCGGTSAPFDSGELNIAGFTATQLSGFKYRIKYDDGDLWAWGFCFTSPTITSQAPPSCSTITGLTVGTITSTTANLIWNPGTSETAWEVAVQAAGTGIPTGSGDPTTLNSPYTAVSLSPATNYEAYVRADCGTDGFSDWVGPVNFLTDCVSYTAPYTEDFENAGVIPICWSMNGGEVWRFANTGAGNHIGNNGAITGTTASNGYFAWVDSSGADAPATLLSPLVDVSGLTTPALSFYEISDNEGNANSTLTVDVWDGAAWNTVGVFNTNTSGWEQRIIDLSPLTITGDVQVRFVFSETVSADFYDDIAIDDVRLDEAPACIIPSGLNASNVTGTTADISWMAGTASTWEYVIQPSGTGVPSGNGTPLAVTTVNETGLDYSTSYEVFIRTDCGSGIYSEWVGPLTFTTTIQTNFTVDCNVGPATLNYCYSDGGENNPEIFTFTSSDGTPLNLNFNSGNIEDGWDELVVIDTDGSFIVDPADLYYGNGGDLSGLTYQSTGDTISFYINSDGVFSCESSGFTPIDVTVSCATCVNPIATYAVRSDCLTAPQFFVDIDVTSLGSATSLTLTDNQGSAPQTVTAVGLVSFGPYPNTTNVQITVANDDDVNCVVTSNVLTQPFCLDNLVDCNVGPLNVSYCYENNESNVFSYTSSDGSPLNLTINSGEIEGDPFDFLVILDSDGVTQLYNGEGNNGIITGLTFQSTGDTIYFSITSDGSVSCSSGSFTDGIDYTVSCATCINPAATYTVIDDCANGQQFLIDVNITSIGDATSVTVTDNQGSAGVQATAPGVIQMGPYPFATPIIITISNDQDVNCVINSTPIQVAACPPANDNCPGATVAVVNAGATCDATTPGTILAATPSGVPAGSCAGNPDDDVWFQFTALDEVELISLLNITGGTGNLNHAVYSGTCGALTELYCSPNTASVTPLLTVGNTYYIRVFSGGNLEETSIFDLCIQKAPENTICEQAANFCSGGGGATGSNIIGFPSIGQIACLFTAPNPSWNIIQIGDPGLIEIQIDQVNGSGNGLDVDFVLWGPFDSNENFCAPGLLDQGCPNPGDCPNNTTNGNFYPYGNIIDCSYSAAPTENLTIDNALSGEIYVLLVTNFSNQAGTITITQTNAGNGGAGSTVADIQVDLGVDQELCGYEDYTITADSPFADTYEWYADGFIIENETGPTLTVTETNIYTVIVYDTQCDVTATDEVIITFGNEPTINPVQDLITCDDISGDGFEDFDLESLTATVLGSQDPSMFNVTYHLSQSDANTGTGALTSPYTNISSPQTIWIRVEDANATFCIATASFQLIVSGAIPTATSANIEVCDDTSGDGFESFDLASNDVNILNGQSATDYSVTYYLTDTDANAGTNALISPYTNTTNPQTIWARVDNNAAVDCYAIVAFDLIVNANPTANVSPDVPGCDADDNGIAEYDLTVNESDITGGQVGVTVTYYNSMSDANAGTGSIGTPTNYETSLSTIYVRVDDETTGCFSVTSFDLVAGELPMTTFTADFDYEVCPNATVPIIIAATPQNYTAADVSIVWYQDGDVVSGQTGLTLPVLVEGTYTIEVTFNETGCKDSVSQDVIKLESCIIPQGISPNGDGKNDTFDLSNFDVQRIEIFNRLGTLVYSKDNYTDEWHGQADNGDELPVGTYFYTMIYEGGAKQMSAWVYINK